jgi:protein ATS1
MLFAFGSNGNGQLGLGHREDTHIPTPCVMPDSFPDEPPKKVAAGGNHTLVLYPDGTVLATGSNEHGQCGIPPIESVKLFTQFQIVQNPPEEGSKWIDISAGWEFSLFLSSKGNVYSCGHGNKAELGHGNEVSSSPTLRKMDHLPHYGPVTAIASGMTHSLAVNVDTLYGWGANRKEQLGGPVMPVVGFRKINILPCASAVACGREFGFAITRTGDDHRVMGGEKYGVKKDQPKGGELKGWKSVQAAWGGMYVLMQDGTITAWGRNDKGQLPPPGLSGVEEVAIGSEHGVAIVKDAQGARKAVAWGWGEHGNCGRSRNDRGGNVVGEVFEVPFPDREKLVGVGAGCATSWLWTK